MNNVEAALSAAPFFGGLAERHRCELAGVCIPKTARKREHLFHEGERGHGMFLLVSGDLQLHNLTEDGREVVIRLVEPGEVFAEVVLFECECYPVSARALTHSELLLIPRAGIRRLLSDESFRDDFIAMLMAKQRYLARRIGELTTRDVEQRLLAFLRDRYGSGNRLTIPLSKKDVAAAIGTTPESLSRLLQRLQEEHVMTWKGAEVRFLSEPEAHPPANRRTSTGSKSVSS